ncbi:unnamed protein product [Phytomonas sp. Hart1]|nr:unnamed protein product [Phytomonas sp. Hart1]|eukprot:CCW71091.1 unnamed protein product [Phytomonas sp. isolate Hart1]
MRASVVATPPFLVDVAVNLTDCVFRGVGWNGKRLHEDDFDYILRRAAAKGVHQMIITGTSLPQCEKAIRLCRQYPGVLFCTVGVHPAHTAEFTRPLDLAAIGRLVDDEAAVILPGVNPNPISETEEANAQARLRYLFDLVERNRDVVVGVGEIGLDYAELSCCPREIQERYFIEQLRHFAPLGLPFIFHSRECGMRLVEVLNAARDALSPFGPPLRGVVHSFNGSHEEQAAWLKMGFYLSLNGSAFREEKLARRLVSHLPRERLLLETDAPWCDLRRGDYGASFLSTTFDTTARRAPFELGKCVERRNEPCHLVQILEAYLGARKDAIQKKEFSSQGESSLTCEEFTKEELTRVLHENVKALFGL